MTTRGLPAWYSWVVVVLLPIMASVGTLVISLRINTQSLERERVAREQAQQQTDAALCAVFAPIDDGYRATPPATDSGKAFAKNLAAARRKVCHT
jgi:type II secretory pathway pseudopilin PulG